MKKFACDVCGIELKQNYELTELYDDIKPIGISDVCVSCYAKIVIAKSNIEEALRPIKTSWIKGIIKKMKEKT